MADKVPSDDKFWWLVKRNKNGRMGGKSKIQVEKPKKWLRGVEN